MVVGRERQLARASATLTRVLNSGEAASSALVLTGARGLGKTVTLGVVRDIAVDRGFATTMLAFDSVSDNVRLLAGRLAETVQSYETHSGARWSQFRERLSQLSVEFSAGVVKITSAPPPERGDGTTGRRQALVDLLVAGARLAVEDGHAGLVVLLDELQEAPRPHLVVICNAIQDALASGEVPLAVFAAGLPQTPEAVMAAASFTERFDFRVLDPLNADAAERALLEPALAQRVTWDRDAATAVLSAANGSPYLIQRFGDEAWVRADPAPGGSIAAADAAEAVADVRESLGAGMFRGRWVKATASEQEFMAALAQVAQADGIAQIRHVAALTGRTTPQLSSVRGRLLDKGLVESVSQGRLRFTMPGFAEFVRGQVDGAWYGPQLADGSVTVEQLRPDRPALPRGQTPDPAPGGSATDDD